MKYSHKELSDFILKEIEDILNRRDLTDLERTLKVKKVYSVDYHREKIREITY